MNNKTFLNEMQHIYETLKYFYIEDDFLVLNYEGNFKIPFTNVILSSLNPNLFMLDPKETFHILYMLELLPKKELSISESEFIKQYVTRYLKLNDMALSNSNIDTQLVWGLSIPIYSSYDPEFINNQSSLIIQNLVNSHSENLENSNSIGKQQKLVLVNPNFEQTYEDPIVTFEKAGFTTLLLIASTVVATSFYIIHFILGS